MLLVVKTPHVDRVAAASQPWFALRLAALDDRRSKSNRRRNWSKVYTCINTFISIRTFVSWFIFR
jgi:hypothetical protein